MSETPLVNVHTLRRDIYILSALLLADKAIANIAPLAELSTNHYESELNRLLIMMATAARQLLDNNAAEDISEIAARECGAKVIGDNRNALDFRDACNAIIHAVEVIPYPPLSQDSDDDPLFRETYAGIITVQSKRKQTLIRAELAGSQFVQCCIMLTNLFLET